MRRLRPQRTSTSPYYLMLYPGNNPQFIIALPLAACLLEGLLEIVWKNLGSDHS